MSTESTQISGRLCTLVTVSSIFASPDVRHSSLTSRQFEAVSSEAADESVGLLIAHSQYIRSHVPTCRTFRIHRFETKMMVYEEYVNFSSA